MFITLFENNEEVTNEKGKKVYIATQLKRYTDYYKST